MNTGGFGVPSLSVTAGAANRFAFGDGFLPFIQYYSQSKFVARVLGIDVSVLRAHHDAGAHRD